MTEYAEIAIELINELHTERLEYESEYVPLIEAANRLFEYEDIGFSPEELQKIVDKQKWHVVAEGDLPPKLKDGKRAKTYLITKQNGRNDTRKSIDFAFWDGETFGRERKCNIGVSGVLAWRKLPEPWEGEK